MSTMGIRPNVMDRNLRLAEQLTKKNNGKLPSPWNLIQQGYGSLYRYIKRHPEEFSKFKFEKAALQHDEKRDGTFNLSIRKSHLETAVTLASGNHGIIPSPRWLNANGYSRLASYIRIYPTVFSSRTIHRLVKKAS